MKLLWLSIILILTNLFFSFGQSVVINEIMSANETTIKDEDGDYSDWIEFYNYGNETVNFEGFYISDDTSNFNKWAFPLIELMPDSFLLIFASGKDRIEGPFLHTNFKIDSDGENLILSDSLGNIIDHILPIAISTDISYGRKPDAGSQFLYFDFPSPGKTNDLSNSLYFSRNRGFYTEPFKLFITSDSYEDQIYYTLDGSIPTPDSEHFQDSILMDYKYNLPNVISEIPTTPDSNSTDVNYWQPPAGPVDKANIIRVRSFNDTIPTSKIYTLTFFVDSNIFTRYPYPALSLISDSTNLFNHDTGIYIPGVYWDASDPLWTGNYYQTGSDWERDMHIEYFDKTGEVGFAQNAGVRIHGKQTRRRPQKTLRFYARKEYGKEFFNYQILPQKDLNKYKRFLLTTTYGCWHNTIIKDVMTHDLVRQFEMDIMDYRLVVVFLNGEYWGIQTLRDYQDYNHISLYYEINENSIDLLRYRNEILHGSNESYNELVNFIENNDLSIPGNYDYIASQIDIDNFISYQITEIFFNNQDWPASNIKFWRSSELDNKWRWLFYDIDAGYCDYNYNMLEHATLEGGTQWPNPDWSTLILRKLLQNDTFKELFIQRFANLLNTTFQSDSINLKIQEFTTFYEQDIDKHIYRWSFPKSKAEWINNMGWALISFANNRPCTIREHIMEFFDLDEFGFSCDTLPVDTKWDNKLNLFPNPNNGNFTLRLDPTSTDDFHITILNSIGAIIYSEDYSISENELNIDTGNLESGLYFLLIFYEKINITKKFIILRDKIE
ncbi:MAG: CotH kinase family protein [Bacteroidales bacterium]|nr:CotH kinase family protein [Bacteroidales bacterium]